MEICESDPNAAWVDTDAYNGKMDGLHYTGAGYQHLGENFATATIALLNTKESPSPPASSFFQTSL